MQRGKGAKIVMFELDDLQIYKWHKLFMFLSMERTKAFLFDIQFPNTAQINVIQQIAKVFVRKFYEIERNLFKYGKLSEQTIQLFDDTSQALIDKIGLDEAQRFCDWGNQILMDTPFEKALWKLWDNNLHKLFHHTLSDYQELLQLPKNDAHLLQTVVLRYHYGFKGMMESLDFVEALPKAEQDLYIYRLYNLGDRRDIDLQDVSIESMSPLTYLETIIDYMMYKQILCHIKAILSDEGLTLFQKWVSSTLEDEDALLINQYIDSC